MLLVVPRRMRFSPSNGADLLFGGAPVPPRCPSSPKVDGRRRKERAQVVDIRDVEVIAPNFKRRLSGVTSSIIQLVPVQRALGQKIAVLGPGLPKSLPSVRFRDLIRLWKRPPGRRCRVWHEARLEPRRLLHWIVAYAGLSAAWFLGDGENPESTLTIAEIAAAELHG